MLHISDTDFVIDAYVGNSALCCNHHCEPSAEFCTVRLDCDYKTVVFVKALVDIPSGSEITMMYGWGVHDDTPSIVCECGARTYSTIVGYVQYTTAFPDATCDRLSVYSVQCSSARCVLWSKFTFLVSHITM